MQIKMRIYALTTNGSISICCQLSLVLFLIFYKGILVVFRRNQFYAAQRFKPNNTTSIQLLYPVTPRQLSTFQNGFSMFEFNAYDVL